MSGVAAARRDGKDRHSMLDHESREETLHTCDECDNQHQTIPGDADMRGSVSLHQPLHYIFLVGGNKGGGGGRLYSLSCTAVIE